jgi:uncharacterized SAM-binding protein YcdF (DUF218 family)
LWLTSYFFSQEILTVDSGSVKADAIVILGGGGIERPERAAELFKHGDAPKILVSGVGDFEQHRKDLLRAGVPGNAIQIEGKSKSTRENAEFSIPLLRGLGVKRVIIVTDWYHSRRALHCFEHYGPDITFYSRPSYFGYSRAEWNSRGISGYITSEYVKLLGYWVCYGACPL